MSSTESIVAVWNRGSHADVVGFKPRGIQGRVVNSLGERIVCGFYPPGSLLPRESELMDSYKASRTSIREVIKILSAKGLVETRQKIGTRVLERSSWNIFDPDVLLWHPFDTAGHDILRDLIEMRQLVEPPAARFAATRATLDDIERIRASCEDMRLAMGDMTAYAQADVRFHMAVFEASHNAMLDRFGHIVANFLQISFRIQQEALDTNNNLIEDDWNNHFRIYEAINRSDPAAAEELMLRVVLHGKASLQKARQSIRA
ncbi:FadR/GntR family transcriptional regulator [Aestuariivirga sp.]|jgi:GntR family transcriptional regulator, galactonate operon transcriptional repressor|uniref:FadR/GntR family transcriptional regulator n=1 Tax=Aestuariivirga sp. TaxID=2650926 RepID=UPI003BACA862